MKPARVITVIRKEKKDIVRDPVTVAIALLMPLIMLFLFGYAISFDVEDVAMGVLDQDGSPASRELVDRFTGSGYLELKESYTSERQVENDLQQGRIKIVLVIPSGFSQALTGASPAPLQVLIDGTYSVTANLITAYTSEIVAGYRSEVPSLVNLETRVWYNPSLQSVAYVIPGLFGVILMAFPPLLTALAITREKESGSIQQVFTSPLSATEFLAGKLVPYGIIAFLQIVTVIIAGFAWFEVPLRGNLNLLLAAGLVYVFCTVGIGLLVSTITKTQLTGMLMALIMTLMPSFLFSGFLFPIFTMPWVLQLYTRIFPARYFVDLSRGIVLKGAALPEIWPNFMILFLYTIGIFGLAVWRFRKKVA